MKRGYDKWIVGGCAFSVLYFAILFAFIWFDSL